MRLTKRDARIRRHRRLRSKVAGTAERPRIAVFRSNRHVSVQAIDDMAGKTLAACSTCSKESKANGAKNCCNRARAEELGREMGAKLKGIGVNRVIFDRGGYIYHGVVKALADGIRSADEENHFFF